MIAFVFVIYQLYGTFYMLITVCLLVSFPFLHIEDFLVFYDDHISAQVCPDSRRAMEVCLSILSN